MPEISRVVLSLDDPSLSMLFGMVDLPIPHKHKTPNIDQLEEVPAFQAAGLSGPGLVYEINQRGDFAIVELIMFEPIRRLFKPGSKDEAKQRIKDDLGDRWNMVELDEMPPNLRAPKGGARGDLLWHTGAGWERLQSHGGSVLMTSPDGSPVWLPLSEFIERLTAANPPEAMAASRADQIESALAAEILSRLPLVWYSIGSAGSEPERLRPAVLLPVPTDNGDQSLIVFLSPDDRDWIAMSGGNRTVPRTGSEGLAAGQWRRL